MSPRTRITDEQILDQDFVSENEFNQFFSTVVITGSETQTGITQNFDSYFPGRNLITSGPGVTVTTGTNFIQVFTTALSHAIVGDNFISVSSGTNSVNLSADAIVGTSDNTTVISGTNTVTISGMVTVTSGIACIQDSTRNGKTLSVTRAYFAFGRHGLSDNEFLEFASTAHTNSGPPMIRNGTIVSYSAFFPSGPATKLFEVRKNNSGVTLSTLNLMPNTHFFDDQIDIDLDRGDRLQVFVGAADQGAQSPTFIIEVAWRL